MKLDVLLAGVGGQGILSIAHVIDTAALARGLRVKQSEVHGMAQRGGAVQSHLRLSDGTIHSDLVPQGQADLVLATEPLEGLRYVHYLRPGGVLVSSLSPVANIADYPPAESLRERLLAIPEVVLVDGDGIARAAADARAQNMVLLGAALPFLGLATDALLGGMEQLFGPKGKPVVRGNLRAFRAGAAAGAFFTACLEAGLPRATAAARSARLPDAGLDLAGLPCGRQPFAGAAADLARQKLAALDLIAQVSGAA